MTEIERREFLKSTGAALAGVAGVGVLTGTSCNRQSEIRNPTREELIIRLQKLAESKPPKNLMHEELVKRLQKLAKSEPPNYLMHGAMCYKMAPQPRCSDCERWLSYNGSKIDRYRVPVERLRERGLDATLIAPELCPTCGSALDGKKFLLEIKYPDHPDSIQVELKDTDDLMIMELFLQGKDRYDAGNNGENALKNKVDRLRELFGVKESQ